MAVKDVLPTSNLKYEDIRDTLNAGGGNVTDDVITAFSDAANINMWSFFKPHYGTYDFPDLIPDYTDRAGSLFYDEINKKIVYRKPTGGEESPYRLSDFVGYQYKALPPSIDSTALTATASQNKLNLTIEPYWGNANYDWGKIFKGLTFDEMQIKVEVYNQSKKLVATSFFKIKDIDATGRYGLTFTAYNLSGNKIYLRGYYCDYDGNELCMIPSSEDGFVEKPLIVSQSLYMYMGQKSITSGFTLSAELTYGDGSYSSSVTVNIYNTSGKDYVASYGYPSAYVRYRALDGSYTTDWFGGSSGWNYTKNIPNGFTRSDSITVQSPPDYGSIYKWYLDIEVRMM